MRGYFVTATGTDIGKTYVSARLIEAWRNRGIAAEATKPLMSGFAEEALEQSDAGRLLVAMGRQVTPASVAEVCLHRLTPPLAPNVAMRQAGVAQNYNEIRGFVTRRLSMEADVHLVEGAGGVMSPLTDETLQIDLMADLQLKVILVTAPYLGSISHTLTAIDALRARGLEIAALVVSQPSVAGGDPVMFLEEIARFRKLPAAIVTNGADANNLDLLLGQQETAC